MKPQAVGTLLISNHAMNRARQRGGYIRAEQVIDAWQRSKPPTKRQRQAMNDRGLHTQKFSPDGEPYRPWVIRNGNELELFLTVEKEPGLFVLLTYMKIPPI